ncbi:MAG: hypothetical protein MJE77_23145 [Proteobacteria bacterium]|nr:hypothetical protein [Pseudomonadota bacterium]
MIERKRITLHLNRSRGSHAFRSEESLWHNEIRRMLHLVFEQIDVLSEKSDEYRRHPATVRGEPHQQPWLQARPNRDELSSLAMALFGTYGSGKSSLLRTFADWVKCQRWRQLMPERFDKYSKRMYSLDAVLLNATDKGDEFVYAFLAAALEDDLTRQKKLREQGRGAGRMFSPVQECFQQVSEYLQAIDDNPRPTETDPRGISLERLDRHSSVARLQDGLRQFVDVLADEMTGCSGESVIILPVDDADMHPGTLRSALHTYRIFLQHPRLVPVFTFTGRIAEELLRIHFEDELTLGGKITVEKEKLEETSTNLTIAESLAVQYMGKIFPVRSRIKLSQASERALDAEYSERDSDGRISEVPIKVLLYAASRLFFGVSEWPLLPEIRAPLKSAMLRRQIQIIDAMRAAGVDKYVFKEGKPAVSRSQALSWNEIFDRASWALLNIHRDVLKEYDLNLDDLYSWTPDGLRQAILMAVLKRPIDKRRQLIHHWRYRTTDRRSQMLSLLAACVFRPAMKIVLPDLEKSAATDHFSVQEGFLWFLNLWVGFYLPQLVARNRPYQEVPPVTGIGWNLRSGPVRAMREAWIDREKNKPTGMMLLNTSQVSDMVKLIKQNGPVDRDELWHKLILDLWCYRGAGWAAVSFWRGLGLLGQVLEVDVELWGHKGNEGDANDAERQRKTRIEAIIWRHLKNSRIVSTSSLDSPEGKDPLDVDDWQLPDLEDAVTSLAAALCTWLKDFHTSLYRIEPMYRLKAAESDMPVTRRDWKGCFVRRMHGENLISHFWKDLESQNADTPTRDARMALQKWCLDLAKYWNSGLDPSVHCTNRGNGDGGDGQDADTDPWVESNLTQVLVFRCPFVKPFAPLCHGEVSTLKWLLRELDEFVDNNSHNSDWDRLFPNKQVDVLKEEIQGAHNALKVFQKQLEDYQKSPGTSARPQSPKDKFQGLLDYLAQAASTEPIAGDADKKADSIWEQLKPLQSVARRFKTYKTVEDNQTRNLWQMISKRLDGFLEMPHKWLGIAASTARSGTSTDEEFYRGIHGSDDPSKSKK